MFHSLGGIIAQAYAALYPADIAALILCDTAEMAKIYDLLVRFRTPELEKIKVSTLIINGEHESQSVFRHAEYLQKLFSHTQVTTIPGAGHLSNVENPEAFNEGTLRFLEEVRMLPSSTRTQLRR